MEKILQKKEERTEFLNKTISLFSSKLEAEMVSEKLRDIILFHSYNNNVLTTYFNKIVEDNKLDYVVKESLNERNKLEELMKNLDYKHRKSTKDLEQSLSVLNKEHNLKMKELSQKKVIIDQEFKTQLKNIK